MKLLTNYIKRIAFIAGGLGGRARDLYTTYHFQRYIYVVAYILLLCVVYTNIVNARRVVSKSKLRNIKSNATKTIVEGKSTTLINVYNTMQTVFTCLCVFAGGVMISSIMQFGLAN